MGDFEDVFGAGADAVAIIDRFNRDHLRHERRSSGQHKEHGTANADAPQGIDNTYEAWRTAMRARGYEEGPAFASYADLAAWEKTNTRPHVRMKFAVFFTDKLADTKPLLSSPSNPYGDDEIPF